MESFTPGGVLGLVPEALPPDSIASFSGSFAMGHVRYSTVAKDRDANIQPFVANIPYGRFAIAHNGNIKDQDTLRSELEGIGSILSTTMDTELLVHCLARSGADDLVGALQAMSERVKGAYSLVMLCGEAIYACRDPHGIRPLVLGRADSSQSWVVASETCALDAIGATYLREVKPGEIVRLDTKGLRQRGRFRRGGSGALRV